ncbi:MAG: CHASE3 domain-containing protein [Proteobacteria bacterium]|nr:CHASE3 domain-containing protein [Pseudomonadota bacterium]
MSYAALVASVFLLVASAVAVNINLGNLQRNRELVQRTNAILRATAELQRDVRTAEAGQRGYLLTADPAYLRSYEAGRLRAPLDQAQIRRLVIDREQQARLRALDPAIRAKLDELALTVRLAGEDRARALEQVRTGAGQRLMDDIDARLEAFDEAERDLLEQRSQAEQKTARAATHAAALTGLLSLLTGLIGIWALLRQRSLGALRVANAQLEGKVRQRTATLDLANKELDAFAYSISHDLRAPLRAMHGYADAVLEDYGDRLPEEGARYLRRIGQAADRMNALINDILAYARLAREELSVRPVDLDTVVRRVVADLTAHPDAEPGSVTITSPLGGVLAHPAALQQCVANLLDNALKYVPPGRRPEVTVRAEPVGADLRLWIEDQGLGVAPEHHGRVFEPFERLHGREAYPGTGIGLAIVRRSMERMGGSYGVDSRLGEGSRFWIQLPQSGEETSR